MNVPLDDTQHATFYFIAWSDTAQAGIDQEAGASSAAPSVGIDLDEHYRKLLRPRAEQLPAGPPGA